jgi:glucose/arabinose dehydrogenase
MERLLALAVPFAVLVVACGAGADRDRTTRSTTTSTRPSATTAPASTDGDLGAARVQLTKVADVLEGTTLVARPGDDALYVAQQRGQVVAVRDGRAETVLDISDRVTAGGERGLLGIAFSPDGSQLYVHSSGLEGETRFEEYAVRDGLIDAGSARLLLTVPQPQSNHNGGQVVFGPDGLLYLGLGDGGGPGDQGAGHAIGGNGQSLDTLLGKILRIDPRPSDDGAYTIPADNPFASGGGRPEIWAYGLRNPWRFSFDDGTLWIADVGQDQWEEINAAAADRGGVNYGWNVFEGTHPYRPGDAPSAVAPVHEISHDGGDCSVTGGYVYRGQAIPALRGSYVYSDYCNGTIRALRADGGSVVERRDLGISASEISSFGVGPDGELYVVSQREGILRVDPA